MSNYLTNRLSSKLSPKQILEIKPHLEAFKTMMPSLNGLTPTERVKMTQIRRDNRLYVEDTIQALGKFPRILPSGVDKAEMEQKSFLSNTLDEIQETRRQVMRRLRDNRKLAGSEAFLVLLKANHIFKMAAAVGIPGMQTASEHIEKLFEGDGNRSSSNDEKNKPWIRLRTKLLKSNFNL